MPQQNPASVPDALADILRAMPHAALAFSGGVDSAYLLYAAKACGVDVRAYYVNSCFQPRFELNDAHRLVNELNADMTVLPLDVLQNAQVRANPADRCYHCKRLIMGEILRAAASDGYAPLLDGTNADDDAGDRPGMRALSEFGVRSPLREAGLTKQQVRDFSREAGLFTHDKPAYACLATRLPEDTEITAPMLSRVEAAEDALHALGFTDIRARVLGEAAKLQLPAAQIPRAAAMHAELTAALAPWFSNVLLDLKPR